MVTDCPDQRLRIRRGGAVSERILRCRHEYDKLTAFLWKIGNQARHLRGIERNENLYEVYSGLNPNSAGERPLQPKALKQPLMRLIGRTSDFNKLSNAIKALALISAPKEWADFLQSQLDSSTEAVRVNLLAVLASPSLNLNELSEHSAIRVPVIFRELQKDYRDWPGFSPQKARVYSDMVWVLCQNRYSPSIDLLVSTLSESPTPPGPPGIWQFSMMRGEIIPGLEQELDNSRPHVRATSAALLAQMTWINPSLVPETERQDILTQLRGGPLERLRRMAASDSSEAVRAVARNSIKMIESGWVK